MLVKGAPDVEYTELTGVALLEAQEILLGV